jgi:hypothetical protein
LHIKPLDPGGKKGGKDHVLLASRTTASLESFLRCVAFVYRSPSWRLNRPNILMGWVRRRAVLSRSCGRRFADAMCRTWHAGLAAAPEEVMAEAFACERAAMHVDCSISDGRNNVAREQAAATRPSAQAKTVT